jgi:hypothetical protein
MKIRDVGGVLRVVCDVCQVDLKGRADATIGIHGTELVAVHAHCRSTYSQFFLNSADREITLSQFADEIYDAAMS